MISPRALEKQHAMKEYKTSVLNKHLKQIKGFMKQECARQSSILSGGLESEKI